MRWWRRLLDWLGGEVAPSPEPAVMEGEKERRESWQRWKDKREQRQEEKRCIEQAQG